MKYEHSLVVGDWSDDGHGKSNLINFKCSHDRKEIIEAYIEITRSANTGFHDSSESGYISMLRDYEDHIITQESIDRLTNSGVVFPDGYWEGFEQEGEGYWICDEEPIVEIFLMIVKAHINDLKYEVFELRHPKTINGYWQNDFNHSFGYGIYW